MPGGARVRVRPLRGNVFNYMNSVAIVEKPEGEVYLVALMSNVLRVNSAVEHQTLATYLDRILIRNLVLQKLLDDRQQIPQDLLAVSVFDESYENVFAIALFPYEYGI